MQDENRDPMFGEGATAAEPEQPGSNHPVRCICVPRSLLTSLTRPMKIEFFRGPGGRSLQVLPAHPGALCYVYLVPAGADPPSARGPVLRVAEDGTVAATGRLDGLPVQVFDDTTGFEKRLREVYQAGTGGLDGRQVCAIGLGSFGSTYCTLVSRAGVRRFVIVDLDTVEAHNIVKSIAYDLRTVGWPKPEALEYYLQQIRPGAEVHGYAQPFDEAFLLEHGAEIIECDLVYWSADDLAALRLLVEFLGAQARNNARCPLVLVNFAFSNARNAILMFWDPADAHAPCPMCFFTRHPAIGDARTLNEEVDPTTYSATRFSNAVTPQIGGDIARFVSDAVSFTLAMLAGSHERFACLAAMPWLYSFALRGPSPETDDIRLEDAGKAYLWPEYPYVPFTGCPCCVQAGRAAVADPGLPSA